MPITTVDSPQAEVSAPAIAPAGMIYRWEDVSGALVYGSAPPSGVVAELIAMDRTLSIVPGRSGRYTPPRKVSSTRSKRSTKRRWSLSAHREKLLDSVKQECRWPMGKAWEQERNIAKVENPAESIWMDPYCGWIAEIADLRCRVEVGDFAYEQYCPRRPFVGRPALQ